LRQTLINPQCTQTIRPRERIAVNSIAVGTAGVTTGTATGFQL
jgi:hypothetical protein